MNFKNSEKDKKSRIYIFLIILVLLLINGLLIYKLIQREKVATLQEIEIEDLSTDKDRLNRMLEETELQLDDYKGKNALLDSVIFEKNNIITKKVASLRNALAKKGLTQKQIIDLEKQIKNLNGEVQFFQNQVDSLSGENEYLANEVYTRDVELKKKDANIAKLNKKYREASEKVKIGSILKATFIEAGGVRKRRGKEKVNNRLSRADLIRIGFVIDKNEIAQKGLRTVYLQLIAPSGNTLHDEKKGSGKLIFNGEATLFTTKKDFVFNNSNEELEFNWEKTESMKSGVYKLKIYCDGNMIGSSKFTMK